MEDASLRLDFHRAIDAVTPPAPWLADHVRRELRRRHALGTPIGRGGHYRTAVAPAWLLPAVAALLAIAIVVALVAGVRGLYHSIPVKQPQPVPTRQPLRLSAPIVIDCSAGCNLAKLVFASPSVAWAIVSPQTLSQTEMGPSNLYRTVDGGQHWQALVSWDNPGQPVSGELTSYVASDSTAADQLKVSADGKEALVITGWSSGGAGSAGLFHTTDGGLHWNSFGFPTLAEPTQVCGLETYLAVSSACAPQMTPALRYFFLNPREGWVVSQESASSVDDVFHTTDSGAHWVLFARITVTAQLDLLRGRLVFESSSAGWFVPDYTGTPVIAQTLYRTADGGRSWTPRSLVAVPPARQGNKPGGPPNPQNAVITSVKFFNDRDGVVEVARPTELGAFGSGESFVYTTSDGGATWSAPSSTPNYGVDFIDAANWEVYTNGGLDVTHDAGKSWASVRPTYHGGPTNLVPLIRPMRFVDQSHGWAGVGCSGILVFATSDGGANWTLQTLPFPQPSDIGGACI